MVINVLRQKSYGDKRTVKKFADDFLNQNWSSLNKLLTKLHQTSRPTVDSKPTLVVVAFDNLHSTEMK